MWTIGAVVVLLVRWAINLHGFYDLLRALGFPDSWVSFMMSFLSSHLLDGVIYFTCVVVIYSANRDFFQRVWWRLLYRKETSGSTTAATTPPVEAPHDFPFLPEMCIQEVIQYILTETEEGVGKTEDKVAELLRWAAEDSRIRVVGFHTDLLNVEEISPDTFKDHSFTHLFYPDNWVIAEPQGTVDRMRREPPRILYHFLKFDRRQVEKLWPRKSGAKKV